MIDRRQTAAGRTDPRLLRVLALAFAVAVAATTLRWAVGPPIATVQALVDHPVEFDALLSDAAGLAAWLGLGWLCLATGLELAGAVPGWCGRGSSAVARRITPPLVRRVAQALIGLSVLAGPISTGSAEGVVPGGPSATAASTSTATATATETASTPLDRPSTPTPAGLIDLDRRATPFLPAAPAPAPKLTPAGPAVLMSGAPHRSVPDDAYVVRRGDALWDIVARRLGPDATQADVAREWPRWYAANRTVIGADPNLIRPGERLQPPAA